MIYARGLLRKYGNKMIYLIGQFLMLVAVVFLIDKPSLIASLMLGTLSLLLGSLFYRTVFNGKKIKYFVFFIMFLIATLVIAFCSVVKHFEIILIIIGLSFFGFGVLFTCYLQHSEDNDLAIEELSFDPLRVRMSSRRLPVYLLIDTSNSMHGEAIQAVNVGLRPLVSALRQDPYALESVSISVITFDLEAKELMPLTPLDDIQLQEIVVSSSGITDLSAALEMLISKVDRNIVRTTPDQKGDWNPLLFVMTEGSPNDTPAYHEMTAEIKKRNFGNIVVCAAGPKAKIDALIELSSNIIFLETTDSSSFSSFFKWVSASVSSGSAGVLEQTVLPPPPPEVQVVF